MNGQQPTPEDAVAALSARGVDNGAQLLLYGTPEEILATCRWWDGRQNVGPGLLARRIRDQDFADEPPTPESPREQLQAKFEEYAARFPVGTPIHSPHYRSVRVENPPPHARIWDRIRQEVCPGTVRIVGANFPTIVAECDQCRYDCATPAAQLHTLERPAPPTLEDQTQEAF